MDEMNKSDILIEEKGLVYIISKRYARAKAISSGRVTRFQMSPALIYRNQTIDPQARRSSTMPNVLLHKDSKRGLENKNI